MKHIIAFFTMALAVCACGMNYPDPEGKVVFDERVDIVLTRQQQSIVSKGNGFAFDFFAQICKEEADQEIFISPFSLEAALCMLCNGAGGDTYAQIATMLGYEGLDKDEINATYKLLISALLGADSSTKFSIANAMWLNNDFPILPSFAAVLTDNYGASVKNLDFSSDKALDDINSWTNKSTGGMIPTLFERLDPEWVYILANALYFKGVWSEKFKTENTRAEVFRCLSGNRRTVDFMHGEVPCRYTYNEEMGAQLCELPFGNKAFLLDILLPDDGIDFNKFVAGLDAAGWDALIGDLFSTEKYVIIPKMEVSYTGSDSFVAALKALGMTDAFGPAADFTALSSEPTYVSDVIQKARFKMDENGAEAAAVTAIVGKMNSAGPSLQFFADHPFVYAIREYSTGAILFMGACRNLQ